MKRILLASLMVVGMLGLVGAPAQAFPANPAPASAFQTGNGPIVQVHGFHCRPAWAPGWGWHRHWRACRRRQFHNRWRSQNRRRGARFFCWHNQWSRRVCRRRW
ncbi:MAG: hypothetical protein RLT05_34210 [Bauldia litoralis]